MFDYQFQGLVGYVISTCTERCALCIAFGVHYASQPMSMFCGVHNVNMR
jgi:hypothetical protein